MPVPSGHVAVSGSERAPLPGARVVGPADPTERIDVTVVLRPRTDAGQLNAQVQQLASARDLGDRRQLSREAYAEAFGARPDDVEAVEAFAHEHELDVKEVSLPRRTVVLSGTVAQFSAAFGVDLQRVEHASGTYRGREGAVHVPEALAPIVQAVLGLDNRPQARPHFRRLNAAPGVAAPQAAGGSFTPAEVARIYDFPTVGNGHGQTVAIIELGGGYRTADLTTYFSRLGIPKPKISSVSVDGGHNTPGSDADGEVMLDIEVVGAVAPGARIVVYFAPNTDNGFLDAITTAIHDAHRNPSVVSISWGGPEASWTAQALQAYDQAFQAAAAMGVTVLAAAGDSGSSDGVQDGKAHVDFPASSPSVLACGGTKLSAANGHVIGEQVWNEGAQGGATGGGISDVFPLPTYQQKAGVPASSNPGGRVGRGVPDVAGDADPASGYKVRVDGQDMVIGGTSAVAPLWAGLVAILNQEVGKPLGFLQPFLYAASATSGSLRDITTGNNGAYVARQGWDACTGLGCPDGTKLLSALKPAPSTSHGAPTLPT